MGLSKQWALIEEIKISETEKKTCGCKWNMNDHFEEPCEKHLLEMEAENEREEWIAAGWEGYGAEFYA